MNAILPTADDIETAKTPRGGWSRETLAAWGVPWPPPSGWRRRLEHGDDFLEVSQRPEIPADDPFPILRAHWPDIDLGTDQCRE